MKTFKAELYYIISVDNPPHRAFVKWVLESHENDPEFHRNVILTEAAHFHLEDYVNNQNICDSFLGSETSRSIVEKPLHPQLVTVCCGL